VAASQYAGRLADAIDTPYINIVPSITANRRAGHNRIVEQGGEGTVWKDANGIYEPGRRGKHWIKRKRSIQMEAFVTGFKLGTANRRHAHVVGALEFSVEAPEHGVRPVAWISSWTDEERSVMTLRDRSGNPTLNPTYFGLRAVVAGQDETGRSKRLRHARLAQWLDH